MDSMGPPSSEKITIRPAEARDRAALDRLAGRDSTELPDDDFLIAEVAEEPWAALGLRTGTLIADPFRPTAGVAELLRTRVDHARDGALMNGSVPPLRRWFTRRAVA
jgi:hypothetical protein